MCIIYSILVYWVTLNNAFSLPLAAKLIARHVMISVYTILMYWWNGASSYSQFCGNKFQQVGVWLPYSRSFRGRKLSWFGGNMIFMDCSLVSLLKDAMSPNFVEKKFANSYKTLKFAKVFSLESFSLYIQYEILCLTKCLPSQRWVYRV